MANKTMVYKLVGQVLVTLHTEKSPDDQEWEPYFRFSTTLPPTCRRMLVISRGGGPNAKQRKYVNEAYTKDVKMTVAVVNDSTMVRGIVTALGWFNSHIKPFPYTDTGLEDAFKYLDIQGKEAGHLLAEIRKMKLELGMK
jgi:hypothetical protein